MEALHLYCVAGNGAPAGLGPIGLGGREVFAVRHAGLAALVSRSPPRPYATMKKHDVVPYLFAHQSVIEKAMGAHTVVPLKFGTTAPEVAAVRTILERGHARLTAALTAMEGRIELDVVALWKDLIRALQEVADRDEIRTRKAAIAARPLEETREERIELGRLLKAQLDLMREQRASEMVAALQGLAEAICPHALVEERMILNIALLVQRSREAQVGQILDRLNERYGDRINFRCVGPLPPYSFSTVEVRSFEFSVVDRARKRLGLGDSAALPEVKEAYRRLAWTTHPDGTGVSPRGCAPVGATPRGCPPVGAGPRACPPGPEGRAEGQGFDEVAAAYRVVREYCEAGGREFREREVSQTVVVRLLEWNGEAKVA